MTLEVFSDLSDSMCPHVSLAPYVPTARVLHPGLPRLQGDAGFLKEHSVTKSYLLRIVWSIKIRKAKRTKL